MKSIMKNAALPLSLLSAAFLVGCATRIPSETTPDIAHYGYLDQVPLVNGYPEKPVPWIVVSDRAGNDVFMKLGEEKSPKEVKFLEPLMVIKHRKDERMLQLAEFNPEALLKKIPAKNIKTYGWISEDQLLLWQNALREQNTGFIAKATVVPSDVDVINNGSKYLKNDSVMVFDSPDLRNPLKTKLPIGQLVYVYKMAENTKRFLIGKSPTYKIDSAQKNVYGWVSSHMISGWGNRSGIKIANRYPQTETASAVQMSSSDSLSNTVKLSEAAYRSPMHNIFPVDLSTGNAAKNRETKFFTNALDYSRNSVINVMGQSIMYDRYKEITRGGRKLNIVFALDAGSENMQTASSSKSVLQTLQMDVRKYDYYTDINYGAVMYRKNTCGDDIMTSSLSPDFSKITGFIDEKIDELQKCPSIGTQPMQDGLAAAANLLSSVPDQTNLIVVIGSTAMANASSSRAVQAVTQARARLVMFQSLSKPGAAYNDFVLQSESIVTGTARNIAELSKEKKTDPTEMLSKNDFSLKQSQDGFFALDYPNQSMSQGFVIYPRKGELSKTAYLTKAIDSLIGQVTHENRATQSKMALYFKNNGSDKTFVGNSFKAKYPNAAEPVSKETASQLLAYENPFLSKGVVSADLKDGKAGVEKGILISKNEYEALRSFYRDVYESTRPESGGFSQSSAVNKYLKIVKKYDNSFKALGSSDYLKMPMSFSVARSTGFDNSDEEIMDKYKLEDWKKKKVVDKEKVRQYFLQFSTLYTRLLDNVNNSRIMMKQDGETFYWLNEYFMPSTLAYEEPK